ASGGGPSFRALLSRPAVLLASSAGLVLFAGNFLLIPNFSPYLQQNLGYPRPDIEILYMAGGAASFFALRLIGPLVDRLGASRVMSFGTAAFLALNYVGFVIDYPGLPILAFFVCFMLSMNLRMVPYQTLMSKVPAPAERARFMSLQSTVQHLAGS